MSKTDKRSEPRTPTHAIMVKVYGDCLHIYGYARDISSSGIQIRTFTTCSPYPINNGEKVELEFRLPDKNIDVKCRGELVWSQEPPGGSFNAITQGVRFTEIDPVVREEIETWVNGRL